MWSVHKWDLVKHKDVIVSSAEKNYGTEDYHVKSKKLYTKTCVTFDVHCLGPGRYMGVQLKKTLV